MAKSRSDFELVLAGAKKTAPSAQYQRGGAEPCEFFTPMGQAESACSLVSASFPSSRFSAPDIRSRGVFPGGGQSRIQSANDCNRTLPIFCRGKVAGAKGNPPGGVVPKKMPLYYKGFRCATGFLNTRNANGLNDLKAQKFSFAPKCRETQSACKSLESLGFGQKSVPPTRPCQTDLVYRDGQKIHKNLKKQTVSQSRCLER